MGLRGKLILAVVAVVAGGFAVAGLLSTRQVEDLLLDEVRARGQALLTAMAQPCAMAMANGEFEVVDGYVGQVSEPRQARALHLRYVMVLDHEGRIYSHTDPTRFGQQLAESFYQAAGRSDDSIVRRLQEEGQPAQLEVTAPIVSGVRWGTLVAGFSLVRESKIVAATRWRVFVASAVLAVVSGVVLFWLLTSSLLRPV